MRKLFLALWFSIGFMGAVAVAKAPELQKQKGFVGYVEAGTVVEVKSVSLDTQTLNFVDTKNTEIGVLQASFKNFERALGGGKKVEHLHKVEPLVGREFTLKNNLVLLGL